MKKVVIIDDEPLARALVKEYLAAFENLVVVEECNDGFEGLKAIQTHQPDLLFLDIQMPKINGFEMLELVENPPHVIFTTAFDDYALKAFDANAIDYLLKPFSQERFDKAVQKWLDQKSTTGLNPADALQEQVKQPEERERIVVKTGNNIRILNVDDVFVLEAYDDYVKIHMQEGYHLKKKTMNYYEQVLPPQHFIRTHRSYIINLQQLTRIEQQGDGHVALLRNGSKIPCSRSGYARLKEVLGM